ncbi:uncharacterized protein LOC124954501 [Vespa velutina]|uniref:uncharacterized protein LOC124954501 n=1 Tax=Vespa velutina TaxID=202808 RepID=UPI001FB22C87|nr:uncharacterized protein LOC124954501 [Vespa velutina]
MQVGSRRWKVNLHSRPYIAVPVAVTARAPSRNNRHFGFACFDRLQGSVVVLVITGISSTENATKTIVPSYSLEVFSSQECFGMDMIPDEVYWCVIFSEQDAHRAKIIEDLKSSLISCAMQ